MPVIARIDWITRQLEYGRILHIISGKAANPQKLKFKIVLHQSIPISCKSRVLKCTPFIFPLLAPSTHVMVLLLLERMCADQVIKQESILNIHGN